MRGACSVWGFVLWWHSTAQCSGSIPSFKNNFWQSREKSENGTRLLLVLGTPLPSDPLSLIFNKKRVAWRG